MMGRLPFVLLLATAWAVIVLHATGYTFQISQDEAIQRELRLTATTDELDKRVSEALDRGDVDDAGMYADLAAYMNRRLAPETQDRLTAALSTGATVMRNTAGFATGFVTGDATSVSELAGAVTSDLTVVGDVRDIASEGSKMVAGRPYSELVLGLSVLGAGATAATVATGGGGVVAKLGVSVLKVAARAGTLTLEFARVLTRLVRDAVKPEELGRVLRNTRLTNLKVTEDAITNYARGIRQGEVFPVLNRLGTLGKTAGPGETVRLLKYVHSTEELDNIADMSIKLGRKTRGVIAFTGKTSLRAFRTSLRVFEFLLERIVAFGVWVLVILGYGMVRWWFRRPKRPHFVHAPS